ncbi:MAG TPA: hypothetical protein VGD40_01840 [Chryseosolibacter sp.]
MLKRNVFVIATEYQFLVSLSIIDERFSAKEWINDIIATGPRSSHILQDRIPANIRFSFFPDHEASWKDYLLREVYSSPLENLFVVHSYRAPELAFLYYAPANVRRHLIQDGALFYHQIEKNLFPSRTRQTFEFYKKLFQHNVFLTRFLPYGRYEEKSPLIDEIWLTNPEIYRLPGLAKKKNVFTLFPRSDSKTVYASYFKDSQDLDVEKLAHALIYLAPKIADEKVFPKELEVLEKIIHHFSLKNIFIKLHPLEVGSKHAVFLKQRFGDSVIANYTPADVYIANARNTVIVASMSTSLLNNNPSCRYFALRKYYQKIGLYEPWKNVTMPGHVRMLEDINELS